MSDWLAWQVVDSAFPVGVFAHSWGLEAAWQAGHVDDEAALRRFLAESIQQTGWGVLPLMNAAYSDPERLDELDALNHAFLTNGVANRASRVQGRTLAATAARVWPSPAMTDLQERIQAGWAHVAPLSGVVFRTIGLPQETARKAVLFGAARGVLSAAVRLGVTGSYGAQRMQHAAGAQLDATLERCRGLAAEEICQTAPIVDVLQGAHDRLYSRLFQS
ncbi:MAG: urease accessory protein UreF [Acidobacteria bacterium]|nr:urease accessory protein UreF [Acidobacteriota bacterium]